MNHIEDLKNTISLYKDFLNDAVIFDVGSNIGLFSKNIIDQNIKYKKLHLFEPCKNYFEQSKNDLSDHREIYFYNVALGSTSEKKIIYKSKDGNIGWNTFLKTDPNKESHFYEQMDQEEVSVTRLDDYNIKQLDFLKIDVEGFEGEVLEGGLEIIKKFKPYILVEMGWGINHPNWEKNLSIYQKLFELGYKKNDLNISNTKDVLFEPEYRKLPLSIGILSWKSKKNLENTLSSYQKNGLFEISDDIQILFQEINDKEISSAKKFNLPYIGLSQNIGIGKAFRLLAANAKHSNILLLEHDWELIEDKKTTYKRLFESLSLLNKNFSCIRLRHRKDYGDPLYSRVVYEGNELQFFDSVTKLYSPHLLDCVHWKENPDIDFPQEIQKLDDYFISSSRWANWTNNPCIYKKDFYLNCIEKFVGDGIELEEKISKWWAENEFKVAQGEGLFKHNDIDKNKEYNLVDIFPYFNEEEILELRIKTLDEFVDRFIICDANRTHTGEVKEFTCKKTLEKLKLNSPKIQVLEIDLSNFQEKEQKQTWTRERLQRDLAANYINDNDICFVSDCDEIINPKFLDYYISIAKSYKDYILRAPLVLLSGRADLRVYNDKQQPVVCYSPFFCFKHHLIHYKLSEIREFSNGHNYDKPKGGASFGKPKIGDIFITSEGKIDNVGWHFTWMGDSLKRLNKYKSFMHYYDTIDNSSFPFSQEETTEFIKNYIPEENNTDVLGRKDHILKKYPIQFLPQQIFENKKIKNFLLPPKKISIVQVGTNKAYDELSEYLLKNYEDIAFGVFVEPNGNHNESIKNCYKKYNNIKIENVAVIPSNFEKTEIELFYNTGDLPNFEISSCKREHVEKHTKKYNIQGNIQSINVPCITLENLLNKYNIINLDWLLLDVEGLDAEIILNFNWDKFRIKKVEFEFLHLNEKSDEVCNMFFELGYKIVDSLQKFNWAFER